MLKLWQCNIKKIVLTISLLSFFSCFSFVYADAFANQCKKWGNDWIDVDNELNELKNSNENEKRVRLESRKEDLGTRIDTHCKIGSSWLEKHEILSSMGVGIISLTIAFSIKKYCTVKFGPQKMS